MALVRELANPAYYEPNALKAATNVPLFGAITRYRDDATLRADRRKSMRFISVCALYTTVIVLLILFYVIDGGQLSEQPPVTSATQSQQVNS